MARINHTLDDNSFYEFTVSNNTNNDETSKEIFIRATQLMII